MPLAVCMHEVEDIGVNYRYEEGENYLMRQYASCTMHARGVRHRCENNLMKQYASCSMHARGVRHRCELQVLGR